MVSRQESGMKLLWLKLHPQDLLHVKCVWCHFNFVIIIISDTASHTNCWRCGDCDQRLVDVVLRVSHSLADWTTQQLECVNDPWCFTDLPWTTNIMILYKHLTRLWSCWWCWRHQLCLNKGSGFQDDFSKGKTNDIKLFTSSSLKTYYIYWTSAFSHFMMFLYC